MIKKAKAREEAAFAGPIRPHAYHEPSKVEKGAALAESPCAAFAVMLKRNEIPPSPKGYALVLGTFDGVHLGHAALLARARQTGLPVLVYTFNTSPRGASFLALPEDRERLLKECGADLAVFDEFEAVRGMSPERFVKEVILGALQARRVICGFNYRFGAGASGDATTLEALLKKENIILDVVDAVTHGGEPISSTRIRSLLLDGRMEEAATLLGRPFFYRLPVMHGKKIGSSIGIPTANQRIPKSLILLPRGVYAARVTLDGISYPAVANIGVRPTVNRDEDDLTCETHILGFTGDLYQKKLTVQLLSYLRKEIKFSDLAALRTQIERDMEQTKRIVCFETTSMKGWDKQ